MWGPALGSTSISSSQRKIVVIIETLNVVTVEALVANLQPRSERAHRWKFLDRKTNGFGSTWETSIRERLACGALTLRHEQLGRCVVVELHDRVPRAPRSARHTMRASSRSLATRSCGSFGLLMRYCWSSPWDGSSCVILYMSVALARPKGPIV